MSTLPRALLKTQVKMNVTATIQNTYTAMLGTLGVDHCPLNQIGACQNAHRTPRIRLAFTGAWNCCKRGSATPRQPISSPSGPARSAG